MISATTQPDFAALSDALEAMAGTIAAAHAQALADARAQNPAAWRDAARVWPLFAAGLHATGFNKG